MSLHNLLNHKDEPTQKKMFQTPIDNIQTFNVSNLSLEEFANKLMVLLKKNPSLKKYAVINQTLAL